MTVYVIRDGKLVEKDVTNHSGRGICYGDFPAPMVSRFEAMESPVTGEQITSWRQRDLDMNAANAVDPRDLPRRPFEERRKAHERSRQAEWGTADPGTAARAQKPA